MVGLRRAAALVGLALVGLLVACSTPEPEVIEKVVTQVVTERIVETVVVDQTPQVVEREVTKVVEVEVVVTPTPETATVGGRMVVALGSFDTLDPHMSGDGGPMTVHALLGATLLAKDLEGNYVPYLAESWQQSDDGMQWTFQLRDDVTFHDGTPLTAHDYVYAINRLRAPETAAPQAGRVAAVGEVVALDDYTLQITLATSYPILPEQLSNTAVVQPLLQSFVEGSEDPFGRDFVGVGPYMLKEYVPGDRVVIERNPNFAWGPPVGENRGPYYIQEIEFRFLPEAATIIAGLEVGEIDHAFIGTEDRALIEDTANFQIIEVIHQGMNPSVHMNLSNPIFQDLAVRQALNYAVDRQLLVAVVAQGAAVPQYGVLSPPMVDYWAGVEYVGYHYDQDKAKALLQEAGYTYNNDGMLEKDGQPLNLTMKTVSAWTKLAEVLQEQYKAVGIGIEIVIEEPGVNLGSLIGGNYELLVSGYTASESDVLYRWFHATRPGALNMSKHSDAELDRLLDLTRSTGDMAERRQFVHDVQRHMAETAHVVPLYASVQSYAISNRIVNFHPFPIDLLVLKIKLNDAFVKGQ